MKRFHMCQSVKGAVSNWGPRQWDDAVAWITRDDGSHFRNGEELEAEFHGLLEKGIEVIPVGSECVGFDPKTGCPGHEIPDPIPPIPPS